MANILIVDDSRTSRRMLKSIIEDMGHTVIDECVDGEMGFVKYKELKPDLVTLDITMPKIDGLQALQLIRNCDNNAKAIMITAAGQREKMVQAVRYGASEFITKPYEKEDVVKVINKVLG